MLSSRVSSFVRRRLLQGPARSDLHTNLQRAFSAASSSSPPASDNNSSAPAVAKIFKSEDSLVEHCSVSTNEYPTRTEAPEITLSTAKHHAATQSDESSSSSLTKKVYSPHMDPFDDAGTLSEEEIATLKKQQEEQLSGIQMSSIPIDDEAPAFLPPNIKVDDSVAPETLLTTLDNGVRVVSQETYGQMSTLGVLTNTGSRHCKSVGMLHLLETLAFSSTQKYPSGLDIQNLLQDWGATQFVSHSREQTLHCIDILRPNVDKAMDMLKEVVHRPLLLPDEIYDGRQILEYQAQEAIPELVLGEALQVAAYGQDQQLGQLHFATPESVGNLTPSLVHEFYASHIVNNPQGTVIAGAGIGHDELVDMAQQHFADVISQQGPTTVPSVYKGGECSIPPNPATQELGIPEDENCRIAIAFPVGGWHDDNMVTACVLQTCLGGGSSFSAGGPGKGMYSRMYQQVLNRYGWIETAEAFTSFSDEGGLLGLSGATKSSSKVQDLVVVLCEQLARLAVQPVDEVELSRARNMLQCNVLTQLESRLILFEDMGRQVLTYGKREASQETVRKIQAVTAEDIQRLAQEMLQQPVTIAATGKYLDAVPTQQQVERLFRG